MPETDVHALYAGTGRRCNPLISPFPIGFLEQINRESKSALISEPHELLTFADMNKSIDSVGKGQHAFMTLALVACTN